MRTAFDTSPCRHLSLIIDSLTNTPDRATVVSHHPMKTRRDKRADEKRTARRKKLEKERNLRRDRPKTPSGGIPEDWPPESAFPLDYQLFWICQGVNYLASNADEGSWTPLFPSIYDGATVAPEVIAQTILAAGETLDVSEALGWSAQPRGVLYVFLQRCLLRLKEVMPEATNDEIRERVRKPHDPVLWTVFDELKKTLQARRDSRKAQITSSVDPSGE